MEFYKVEPALAEGKKIKLTSWENAYWYRNDAGSLIHHSEDGNEFPTYQMFPADMAAVLMGKWEIVEEPVQPSDPVSDMDCFSFSEALVYLKSGEKVARKGWNGNDMFLFLADNIGFHTDADLSCVRHLEGELALPAIVLKTADNQFCVGWLASQTDLLAEDWQIV